MSRCTTNLPWGYVEPPQQNNIQVSSPEVLFRQQQREQQEQQYANLPAALLGTLKRDKKPFTYTPGGVNLSEVLEARLQKRMERKKKYMEEMHEQEQEQENHQRRQLVISPTYNTPLNMYSMENALETLEVQAQMAASRSPSSTLPRNYKFKFQDDEEAEPSQSKAFRVLQVMTDTDSYPGNKKQVKDNISEMRWTGLGEVKSSNPSRFFHTLQKITGTDAEEEEELERQEINRNQKRITRTPTAPIHAPSTYAAPPPVAPVYSAPQQQQPSFGSAPKLKRPAAFLPKTLPWPAYARMPAVPPAGTDF